MTCEATGTEVAIRAEGIGKLYRLGRGANYKTLREVLVSFAASVFRGRSSKYAGPDARRRKTMWALRDVSFEVKRGEVLGIIGRNGAGKSTLLKILARITKPTEGRAEVSGRIGSLLEVGTGFHPELTGRENIFLNGAILGMRRAEILRRFDEIVAFAEIEKFLDTPVKRYSSGMYTRLAFAVAAHLDTEILIVDEVLAVGDAEFQKKCLGRMRSASQEEGRTVLFVSHNMGVLNELCQSAILLAGGRIAMRGPTQLVTATYLGGDTPGRSMVVLPRKRDRKLAFRRIAIAETSGRHSACVDVQQSFDILLDYEVYQRLRVVDMAVRITTDSGQPVCTTVRSELSAGGTQGERPGQYRARVRVPAYFLVPGRYSLVVAAFVPDVEMYDSHFEAVCFDVVDTGTGTRMYGNHLGPVFLRVPWNEETVVVAEGSPAVLTD